MKPRAIIAAAVLLSLGGFASAHRLDEYLQATFLSVQKDHIEVSMRLIPGVAVSSSVIASIDSNGDAVISDGEQRAYAERVLSNLLLTVDGVKLLPKLVAVDYPSIGQMREGLGEIHIEFMADLPRGGGKRRLTLENRHQLQNVAYLVNCLVPSDRDIQIVAQTRNAQQSFYQLDFVQAGVGFSPVVQWKTAIRDWISAVGFASLFRMGLRHIAEGTDHLLFLLALLLAAPLVAVGSRWMEFSSVKRSLFRILQIVTAFTAGHSITLAFAAFGIVRVPGRPVEVLIAVSIFVSTIHALRPVFPGREGIIAVFFGLIHGLAFATSLSGLGLGRWERVAGILAFNLGIETMQLMVVAAIMPSLLLLRGTGAYPVVRIGGALFAGWASLGWMAERLFGVRASVDVVMNGVARHAVFIAATLLVTSLFCRRTRYLPDRPNRATIPSEV